MTENKLTLRAATIDDAEALAILVNFAGEDMPLYLWEKMAEGGEDAWEVGRARARREEGGFSYRNGTIAELGGRIAGCLIGYSLDSDPETTDYESMPPMFVPLQQLEDLAPGTWYINIVAAFPEFRGKGVGSRLLKRAETAAAETGKSALSLIVADSNAGARRLYAREGFEEVATRPVVPEDWATEARNWVLMVKSLGS